VCWGRSPGCVDLKFQGCRTCARFDVLKAMNSRSPRGGGTRGPRSRCLIRRAFHNNKFERAPTGGAVVSEGATSNHRWYHWSNQEQMLVESPREEPTQTPLAHFKPQHWLSCHLVLYEFEYEFELAPVQVHGALYSHENYTQKCRPEQKTNKNNKPSRGHTLQYTGGLEQPSLQASALTIAGRKIQPEKIHHNAHNT
jgi:hypothetical protein